MRGSVLSLFPVAPLALRSASDSYNSSPGGGGRGRPEATAAPGVSGRGPRLGFTAAPSGGLATSSAPLCRRPHRSVKTRMVFSLVTDDGHFQLVHHSTLLGKRHKNCKLTDLRRFFSSLTPFTASASIFWLMPQRFGIFVSHFLWHIAPQPEFGMLVTCSCAVEYWSMYVHMCVCLCVRVRTYMSVVYVCRAFRQVHKYLAIKLTI